MRFIDQVRVPIPAKTEHIRRKYLDLSYDEGFYRRKLDIYLPNEGEGLLSWIFMEAVGILAIRASTNWIRLSTSSTEDMPLFQLAIP